MAWTINHTGSQEGDRQGRFCGGSRLCRGPWRTLRGVLILSQAMFQEPDIGSVTHPPQQPMGCIIVITLFYT